MATMCACGQPLHYSDSRQEEIICEMVAHLGEFVSVRIGGKKYKIQRHYMALHDFESENLSKLIKRGIVTVVNEDEYVFKKKETDKS